MSTFIERFTKIRAPGASQATPPPSPKPVATAEVVKAPAGWTPKQPVVPNATTDARFAALSDYDKAAANSVLRAPGFAALPAADQKRFTLLLAAKASRFGGSRVMLSVLVERPEFRNAKPSEQAKQLRAFLSKAGYTTDLVSSAPSRKSAYSISGPTTVKRHRFDGGRSDAKLYEVTVQGRKVPVYIAVERAKGVEQLTIDEVAQALSALSTAGVKLVKRIDVEGEPNPRDGHWARKFDSSGFTSFMSASGKGVVCVYPRKPPKQSVDTARGALVHETGHILTGQAWGEWQKGPKWKPWREAIASDGIVPSKYAQNTPAEDFSETLQLYESVKGTPAEAEVRALMPARFKLLEKLLAEGAR